VDTARIGIILLAAGVACSGCGGGAGAKAHRSSPGLLNTGLTQLSQDVLPSPPSEPTPSYDHDELDRLARQSLDLQALLAAMPKEPEPDPEPSPVPERVISPAATAPAPPVVEPEPEPVPVIIAQPPKPLVERVEDATVLLVDLLRQQATESSSVRAYLGLAALEVLKPGALQTIITPSTLEGSAVSPEDALAVENLRNYLAALGAEGGKASLQQRLASNTELLTAKHPMRLRNVQLCSEVKGFGQFIPLGQSRFGQGRPIRAVVYAEVDHFGYREVNESDRLAARVAGRDTGDLWAVELTQELQLHRAADNLLVWSRPEQAVVETSRNKRRDFYLIQTITLPSSLSIGAYTLKVVVRDATTRAADEVNIPIDIVAEALASEFPR
jgi:hypothetical protein